MLFVRNKPEQQDTLYLDDSDSDRDLIALIDNARTDEEIRRIARLCMQRTRARIEAARAGR